jgi:Arc/MetJ-type ribon-helix-helix transcriptional regulator
MPEPARPIPVKLDVETLAALDALVATGRQPTRSSAIRAGIELLLDAEHRRALDLGLGGEAEQAEPRRGGGRPRPRRQPVLTGAAVATAEVAERRSAPTLVPSRAPEPEAAESEEAPVVDLRPPAAEAPLAPSGPRPGLSSVDW